MFKLEFNTGRNCLKYLIDQYSITSIWIPYYICPVIRNIIYKSNCTIKYYHITDKFMPNVDFPHNDYILYPNYFGICSKNIIELSKKFPNIIFDNAQSFYMKPYGLASFYSLRKFFPISSGAYLYSSLNYENNIEIDNNDIVINNYEDFIKNEIRIENEPLKLISKVVKDKMKNINFKKDKELRIQKFQEYNNKYQSQNLLKFDLTEYDIPFVYPLLTIDGKLPIELKNKHIFRYWNNLPKNFNEYKFYKNLIPIPLMETLY